MDKPVLPPLPAKIFVQQDVWGCTLKVYDAGIQPMVLLATYDLTSYGGSYDLNASGGSLTSPMASLRVV